MYGQSSYSKLCARSFIAYIDLKLFYPTFTYDRLLEIVHADQKLYLVFEYLDMDLKRYMDSGNQHGTPITLEITKVSIRTIYVSITSPSSPLRRAACTRDLGIGYHVGPARSACSDLRGGSLI